MRKVYKLLILLFTLLRKNEKILEYKIKLAKNLGVKIGENLRCFSNPISAEPYLLEFGNNITISSGVKFITHDNSIIKIFKDGTDTVGKIIINDNCFIGLDSIILPGVELGKTTIVGAGSVVTKSFREGNIVIAGNPAKKICSVDEYKTKVNDNYFNFREKTFLEKKEMILNNTKLLLNK